MTKFEQELRELSNEELVATFDAKVSLGVKQENFRKGGMTAKVCREIDICRMEILRRLEGFLCI